MRYSFALFIFLFTLFSLPLKGIAASGTTVSIKPLDLQLVYHKDFDFLVGDFTLTASQAETLNTMTIRKDGTAREGIEYTKLVLWADADGPGFQGWGFDHMLAEGTFAGNIWVFNELDYDFSGDQRFFLSIETGTFVQNKSLNFKLAQPNDANGDGVYQGGESGIFLESGTIATIPSTHLSDVLVRDTKLDAFGPKGFVNELSPDTVTAFYDQAFSIQLTGQARDRHSDVVNNLMVVIGEQSFSATSTSGSFATWEVLITPAKDFYEGPLTLKITDGASQTWTSPAYDIVIDNRSPDNAESVLTVEQLPSNSSKVRIALVLKDEAGNLLAQRSVSVVYEINSGLDKDVSVITDDNGEATFTIDANPGDLINARAVYKGEVLVESTFTQFAPPVVQPDFPGNLSVDDLVKGSLPGVYYLGSDGMRHVFVHFRIYQSWYGDDFSRVKTISDTDLAAIPLGAPVTYRPGTMITAPSINEVYLIDINRTLRHLASETVAIQLFGDAWAKQVKDIEESLLFSYTIGQSISVPAEVNLEELASLSLRIDDEL